MAVETKTLTDFDLSRIGEVFYIPNFQRILNKPHTTRITEAILNNKMYNNVFFVVKITRGTHSYGVVDGQHRLAAYKNARTTARVLKETFHLHIIGVAKDEQDAERFALAFRGLNQHLMLSPNARMHSYDNGNTQLFNKLRDVCTTTGTTNSLPYLQVLYAYCYAKTGVPHRTQPDIEKYISMVTETEAEKIKKAITSIFEAFGNNTNYPLFRAVIIRNIVRIYFEQYNRFKGEKTLTGFCQLLVQDTFFMTNSKNYSAENMQNVYNKMTEKVSKYLGEK